ncbi:MAG TPA: glycosyltransferase family 2 protein, partial [Chroococcales cyanobacterium]
IDGACEMVDSEFPQVRMIRNSQRFGFGHNQNTAIKAAAGRYIFVLNDDTIVHAGAIDSLTTYLDEHQDVGVAGPRLLNEDGTLQHSCYKFPSPLRCVCENLLLTAAFPQSRLFGDYRHWSHDTISDVDFVIGAAMMVRKKTIDEIGLFDPLFFMYAEETDWQKRMHKAGWRIVFYPRAEITHIGGKSSESMKDRQFCEFQLSSEKFMAKHYGMTGALTLRISMIVGALLRLVLWSLVYVLMSGKRKKAKENCQKWMRLLRWWLGLGPHAGLSELSAN